MRLLAPAKINLSLEIEAKRVDGFHELRTLMVPIAFGDEIEIERWSASLFLLPRAVTFPMTRIWPCARLGSFLRAPVSGAGLRFGL